ncbi:Palmitoyltransferase PFA4 [Diplogelasinospora grovesii]|uniref:Palmitoyltransferase PFA4 n=1 Tax=Diplogelasinospora grovesii TaxID=303347 RepID=A0AAN6N9C8_9PEZI|nr:Palmitoyltransferase PFA4 [Diplogelasinospora grovesii]
MTSLKTGPSSQGGLWSLAIPAVCCLILFLGYFSQWLFNNTSPDLAPGPLTSQQSWIFNVLLVCLWWTYYKACTTDPGRYTFPSTTTVTSKPPLDAPSNSRPSSSSSGPDRSNTAQLNKQGKQTSGGGAGAAVRWCKKCALPKPPRSHHCRHCARCIPKMDHHCPWTSNCVSMQTFPHFLRFLVYANISLWLLASHIFSRLYAIWDDRHLPAYLGPTLFQLISLTLLSLVCMGTMIALGVLLVTTVKGWVGNSTMIEDWELERHEAALTRLSREGGGYGGDMQGKSHLHLGRVEFPYDIGLFANMSQAMGTSNPLLWFLPFADNPVINNDDDGSGRGTGWEWEENGFNDRLGMWPPVDPDKTGKERWTVRVSHERFEYAQETAAETRRRVERRQQEDMQRRSSRQARNQESSSGIMAELEELDYPDNERDGSGDDGDDYEVEGATPTWTNSEGDTLWDYGVDEEVEQHEYIIPEEEEDEDVPIAELIRRRRTVKHEDDT